MTFRIILSHKSKNKIISPPMMSAAVEQSRRRKKRRMVVSPSPTCWLMSLPDDMVLNCLARVSRSDHGALSLVSKSNRSLVVSQGLYETRSRMGLTEDCIYVCLDTPLHGDPPRWFILRREKGKSFENRLIPIPSLTTPNRATFVPLAWGIYVIGGTISAKPTSRVSFLDCRTHTWRVVPSMRVARVGATAGVLDGKIYVMGGAGYYDPSNWAEVFDPKMQTWSRWPIPDQVISKEVRKAVGPESFFVNFGSEGCMWNDLINTRDASCELDKLLYSCDPYEGRVMWCDPWSGVRKGRMEWYRVNGLENMKCFLKNEKKSYTMFHGEKADVWNCYLLKRGYGYGLQGGLIPGFKLSKSGGKLFVFWGVLVGDDPKRLQLWCAEILLERRHGAQIWGIVQCFDHVFTVDHPRLHVLSSVTVNL